MIVAGRAFGIGSGVRLAGRFKGLVHGLLRSWGRVLRYSHCVILGFTFFATVLVLGFGSGKFGIG